MKEKIRKIKTKIEQGLERLMFSQETCDIRNQLREIGLFEEASHAEYDPFMKRLQEEYINIDDELYLIQEGELVNTRITVKREKIMLDEREINLTGGPFTPGTLPTYGTRRKYFVEGELIKEVDEKGKVLFESKSIKERIPKNYDFNFFYENFYMDEPH